MYCLSARCQRAAEDGFAADDASVSGDGHSFRCCTVGEFSHHCDCVSVIAVQEKCDEKGLGAGSGSPQLGVGSSGGGPFSDLGLKHDPPLMLLQLSLLSPHGWGRMQSASGADNRCGHPPPRAGYGVILKTTPQPSPWQSLRLPPKEAVPYKFPAESLITPASGPKPVVCPLKLLKVWSTVSLPD